MITLRQVFKNLTKGRPGIKARDIISELEKIFKIIGPNTQIVHAMPEVDGTTVYFKVPSEDKNISYDIIIWLSTKNRITIDTQFKVYSNSPFFAFNLAYVFNKLDSLLYKNYYPSVMYTQPPKIRNPSELIGFDKHLYTALKIISKSNVEDILKQFEGKNEPEVDTFENKQKEVEYLKKKDILYK
jgi:hypothetical protein